MKIKCNRFDTEHELNIIIRNDEIIFALPNGKEVANLTVCAMVNEFDKPTSNFFLVFDGKDCPDSKDVSLCIL